MTRFKRLIAALLSLALALTSLPMSAHAALVSTHEALASETAGAERDKVNAFLARDDVRRALVAQGVDEKSVHERVKAMTDDEVAQLAGRVDQVPAGGDVVGVLFTVFIILLVTDIMGLTKVFPFTRSVR